MFMATNKGTVKKTNLNDFNSARKSRAYCHDAG